METLHDKPISDEFFVPKEGQRGLLCSNKESCRCPSLCIERSKVSRDEVRPILKSLISRIIENEIDNYLEGLYEERRKNIRTDI